MSKDSTPKELAFQVSARTMQMLGRENVSSALVAIQELVKNAYDADARTVSLEFRRASKKDGTIVIKDDGDGMDLVELGKKWMLISTDNKLQDPLTKKGRVKVGEKGIGRLGLDRLARHTARGWYWLSGSL